LSEFRFGGCVHGAKSRWLLVAALILGYTVSKTMLLKRIALYVLTIFPPTFLGEAQGFCKSPNRRPAVFKERGRNSLSSVMPEQYSVVHLF
jgi:hypothetical protein